MEKKQNNNNLKALKSISSPSAKQVQSSVNSMHQLFLCCSDQKKKRKKNTLLLNKVCVSFSARSIKHDSPQA